MNIDVMAVQTDWAIRGLSKVTVTLNPGNWVEVSSMARIGVTSTAFWRRPTKSSIGTFLTSSEYNPNCAITGSSLERLRICCFMLARRWLMSSVTTGRIKSLGTVGCSISTEVCDVYLLGRVFETA